MGNVKQISTIPSKLFRDQLVTVADLEEFKQDLLLSLIRIIQDNANKPGKKWVKSFEVKRLLQISETTIQTFRTNGTLPFTKIGNLIYYDMDDINKVLTDKKQQMLKGVMPPKISQH